MGVFVCFSLELAIWFWLTKTFTLLRCWHGDVAWHTARGQAAGRPQHYHPHGWAAHPQSTNGWWCQSTTPVVNMLSSCLLGVIEMLQQQQQWWRCWAGLWLLIGLAAIGRLVSFRSISNAVCSLYVTGATVCHYQAACPPAASSQVLKSSRAKTLMLLGSFFF